MSAALQPVRRWVMPEQGDDWASIARRALPEQPSEAAIAALQRWNAHIVFRPPPVVLLPSDIVFVEGPSA